MAIHDDEIVGAISYALDETFCVEPVGGDAHAVHQAGDIARRAMGRMLVGLCEDAAKGDGAVAFHAPIAAEVNERTLVNLFAHMGFKPHRVNLGQRPLTWSVSLYR